MVSKAGQRPPCRGDGKWFQLLMAAAYNNFSTQHRDVRVKVLTDSKIMIIIVIYVALARVVRQSKPCHACYFVFNTILTSDHGT